MVGIATQESAPGYMDADYYYANGLRIATSGAWSEPFIWNYLNDPQGLPHPSFSYWMPLAGIISAFGIKLSGLNNFWGARIGFFLIAGFLAPLTSYLAYTFTPSKWAAILAAGLSLFSGFYFAYLPTTETFAVNMVLGCIFFLLVLRMQQDYERYSKDSEFHQNELSISKGRLLSPPWIYIGLGLICGMMYMTRVDGVVWFGLGVAVVILQWVSGKNIEFRESRRSNGFFRILLPLALLITPFILIVSPWFIRNLDSFGTIFAPGSGRALWLTSYDEIFAYPATNLTYERWLNSGVFGLLRDRGWALGLNSLTLFAVQGAVILLPLTLVGFWTNRNDWRVLLGICGWLATFLVMTLIFPFQGARGGFFHAGAGFQPLFWALVPAGLLIITNWVAVKRTWDASRALKMFAVGTVIVIFIMTAFVTRQRLLGSGQTGSAWGSTEFSYQEVDSFLENNGVSAEAVVMVNNPPGYYAMTGRQSIVIPHGDLQSALLAGRKFQASYLILDKNYPQGLEEIYQNPGNYPGLQHLKTINQMHIYFIEQ